MATDYVCIMETNIEGYNLCLRANPTIENIKKFVTEQRRRYYALQPGGPGGNPAVFVKNAKLWRNELDYGKQGKRCFKVIDLSDVPVNPNAAKA